MSSYENKPPYYCLNYILSLWICIVDLDVAFPLFSMRAKRHTHETKTQMKDGKEKGRGRAGHLISSIFQLIPLKASRRRG